MPSSDASAAARAEVAPAVDASIADAGDPDVVEVIPLSGFDPHGEPTIRRMRDGSLVIVFELMPPSWAEEDDDATRFEQLDRELSRMVGVTVEQEDRERFRIARPKPDTVERLRAYLGRFRAPR